MKKNLKKLSDHKHLTYERLYFLKKRIDELERVKMPTIKQKRLLKRYRLEFVKVFMVIT